MRKSAGHNHEEKEPFDETNTRKQETHLVLQSADQSLHYFLLGGCRCGCRRIRDGRRLSGRHTRDIMVRLVAPMGAACTQRMLGTATRGRGRRTSNGHVLDVLDTVSSVGCSDGPVP